MTESAEVRLARIEEMLKGHLERISERCGVRAEIIRDHEDRIGALESWRHKASGGWWVISALCAVSSLIGAVIGLFFPRV